MSILQAYDQTDLDSVDLSFWYRELDTDTLNDDAFTDGYEDDYHLLTTTNDALSLYGHGFGRDGNGDMMLGTIEDINQWAWDPDTLSWQLRWHWVGWNIAAADFFAAGQTASLDDDFDLIAAVMSRGDTLYLSDQNDKMRGYGGGDRIYGYAGNDTLYGNNGKDKLFGGDGNDKLYAGKGHDEVDGGSGNDKLNGGKGKDHLFGGSGKDALYGNSSDDTLRGGAGRDTLFGGWGADVFEFWTGDDKDIIKDFDAVGANHDILDLSHLASIVGWSDLRNNHMRQEGGDVVIDAKFGDLIVLRNVQIEDIDKGDLLF